MQILHVRGCSCGLSCSFVWFLVNICSLCVQLYLEVLLRIHMPILTHKHTVYLRSMLFFWSRMSIHLFLVCFFITFTNASAVTHTITHTISLASLLHKYIFTNAAHGSLFVTADGMCHNITAVFHWHFGRQSVVHSQVLVEHHVTLLWSLTEQRQTLGQYIGWG